MMSNPKFTAFTCRATALALGVVPLAPSDRMQGRPGTSRPPAEAASAITRAKKAAPAGEHAEPAFLGDEIGGREPRLLGEFAPQVAGEIDAFADNIAGIGRSSRKVDFAGIHRVRAHDAEQESAVAAAQRGGRKAVLHAGVRKTPVAPSDEAGEIGFKIGAMKDCALDVMIVQQQ